MVTFLMAGAEGEEFLELVDYEDHFVPPGILGDDLTEQKVQVPRVRLQLFEQTARRVGTMSRQTHGQFLQGPDTRGERDDGLAPGSQIRGQSGVQHRGLTRP